MPFSVFQDSTGSFISAIGGLPGTDIAFRTHAGWIQVQVRADVSYRRPKTVSISTDDSRETVCFFTTS
jgi:hypothetical protein